jgi:hypothetical protein
MSTSMSTIRAAAVLVVAALVVLAGANSAGAVTAKPHWLLQSVSQPTSFAPGDCVNNPEISEDELQTGACDRLALRVTNMGAKEAAGGVTVTDTVPQGLQILTKAGGTRTVIDGEDMQTGEKIPCTASALTVAPWGGTVECIYSSAIPSEDVLQFKIAVEVMGPGPATLEDNEATISGGGASAATATSAVVVQQPEPFRLLDFGLEPRGSDGEPSVQAGDHPSLFTSSFEVPGRIASGKEPTERRVVSVTPVEHLKDAFVYLPLGMAGNPQVVPQCPAVTLQSGSSACPAASRVGTVIVDNGGNYESSVQGLINSSTAPSYVYNLIPEAGYPAEFGFSVIGKPVTLPASVVHVGGAGGGYALRVGSTGIPKISGVEAEAFSLSFWGTPSTRNGGGASPEAFLTNPTNCSGPLKSKAVVDTWENPGKWFERESVAYPQLQNCEAVAFSPDFSIRPEVSSADTPSGYEAVLRIPQNKNISPAIATAQLKNARVTLPEGVALSASAANGLAGCAAEGPEGINIGSDNIGPAGQDLDDPEATELGAGHLGGNNSPYDDGLYHIAPGHCPAASQIGTVEVKTPLLEQPLTGQIYVAKPSCNPCTEADAVSGKLYGIYLEAAGSGVIVKLHGEVSANPKTGQLTATFNENPQFPFEQFRLRFDGGPAAALTNPQVCATYRTETDFTPWSAPPTPGAPGTPDATPKDSFSINAGANGGGCVTQESQEPNAPSFEAGTTNPLASSYSPFVLRLNREDGSQRLERINLTLPPGLVGRLAGIPYCSDSALAAAVGKSGNSELQSASCPAASEVGKVTVGAGPGVKPYYVHGHAYLAGPYKGAPLSLAIVTPAVAGPFDLGTVVVRSALYVNEETAQITAKSDPIPRILDGTPLDVRSIALEIDRSQFMLNPTNCKAMSVGGEAISVPGQTAQLTSRFQVGGCSALAFKPELKLSLKGSTKRSGHPALKAVVTYPKEGAYANIARAQVGLPHTEFLDQGNLDKVCTQPELRSNTCPASSIYGFAKAWTPLLDKPLEGPVYLGVGFGHKLPDVVADLNGQIRILLHGKVDTTKQDGIRNTFEVVPDAPVSRFVLEIKGGKKYGLLENSENLCRKTQRASVRLVAQNGRVAHLRPKITNSCGR